MVGPCSDREPILLQSFSDRQRARVDRSANGRISDLWVCVLRTLLEFWTDYSPILVGSDDSRVGRTRGWPSHVFLWWHLTWIVSFRFASWDFLRTLEWTLDSLSYRIGSLYTLWPWWIFLYLKRLPNALTPMFFSFLLSHWGHRTFHVFILHLHIDLDLDHLLWCPHSALDLTVALPLPLFLAEKHEFLWKLFTWPWYYEAKRRSSTYFKIRIRLLSDKRQTILTKVYFAPTLRKYFLQLWKP